MLNYGESLCRPASSASSSSSSGGSSGSCEQHRGMIRNGGRSPSSSNSTNRSSDQKCSQQSVLTAIERFVRAVNNMDATVLVPSRLHDMEIQNRRKTSLPPAGMQQQQHQDLYGFYVMLREVKTELLWGPSIVSPSLFHHNGGSSTPLSSGMSSPRRMAVSSPPNMMMMTMASPGAHQHLRQLSSPSYRQPSDDGLGSSSTGCSSDQDTDSDFESIVTDRDSMIMEQTSHLANAFRHHLHGLHAILHQLADTADFVSARYQEEVETIMI